MDAISTTLLAFGMSADAFAVAIGKGLSLARPRPAEALKTGVIFGTIEASTPVVGWLLGSAASTLVSRVDHWVAFAILSGLGLNMLYGSLRKKEARPKPEHHALGTLILAGLGTSIDALGVGVTLAFVGANIWLTAAAIGSATFLMASLGVMVGRVIGVRAGTYAEIFGGFLLIGIGTDMLLGHLGLL